MKKVLFVILATAGIIIGMSSCHKYCQCKYYEAGVVVLEDEVEDVTGIYKNCGEYQYDLHQADPDYNGENKTGWYCYKY
jgi:hypothetical protein